MLKFLHLGLIGLTMTACIGGDEIEVEIDLDSQGRTSTNTGGNSPSSGVLAFASGSEYDFGVSTTFINTDRTLTVNYSGTAPAQLTGTTIAGAFLFKGGNYPGVGGTCGASISANCTMVVTYNPIVTGPHSETLSLGYTVGTSASVATIRLKGGTPASLSVSDSPTYYFPIAAVNDSSEHTFIITNSGGAAASAVAPSVLSAPFSFKGGTYPGTGGTCGTTISIGACSIVVSFNPTVIGSNGNSLSLNYNDGVAGQTTSAVNLIGETPAVLAFANTSLAFGIKAKVSDSTLNITLTNSGGTAANALSLTGLSGALSVSSTTCGGSLALGGSCDVTVRFNPSSHVNLSQTLTASYNDGLASQSAQKAVSGSTPAELSLSHSPNYDFGTTAINSALYNTFSLTNIGGSSAGITPYFSGSTYFQWNGAYPGAGGNCGATLAVGASCDFAAKYYPLAAGPHTGALQVDYTNGLGSVNVNRPLSGSTPVTISFSTGASHVFGTTALNTVAFVAVTLTPSGGSAASVTLNDFSGTPFRFKGGSFPGTGGTCTTTISAACTVYLEYAPTTHSSNHTAAVTFTYNTSSSATLNLSGKTPAELSFIPGSYTFPTTYMNSVLDKKLMIQNIGGTTASSIVGEATPLLAPFLYKGGSYPGVGGTCGASLSASFTCQIVIRYAPTASGLTGEQVDVGYDNGLGATTASMSIQGTAHADMPQKIYAYWNATCAILGSGNLKCWGSNDYGGLGQGNIQARGDNESEMGNWLPAISLGTGLTAESVSIGFRHVCAIVRDGALNRKVKCWGTGEFGTTGYESTLHRGDGPNEMGDNLGFVNLGIGLIPDKITSGNYHTCVLFTNGGVKCWGHGAFGKLGNGGTSHLGDLGASMGDNLPYVDLGTGVSTKAISAGSHHTCAITTTDQVKCWGNANAGALATEDTLPRGDGPNEMGDFLAYVDLGAGRTAKSITSGDSFNCVILDNDKVKCWGSNSSGQLGIGSNLSQGDGAGEMAALAYTDLRGDKIPVSIKAGTSHVCVRYTDSTFQCWGSNSSGQLGIGTNIGKGMNAADMGLNLPFAQLGAGRLASDFAAASGHTCVILDNSGIRCFGANGSGQLGLGHMLSTGISADTSGDNLGMPAL